MSGFIDLDVRLRVFTEGKVDLLSTRVIESIRPESEAVDFIEKLAPKHLCSIPKNGYTVIKLHTKTEKMLPIVYVTFAKRDTSCVIDVRDICVKLPGNSTAHITATTKIEAWSDDQVRAYEAENHMSFDPEFPLRSEMDDIFMYVPEENQPLVKEKFERFLVEAADKHKINPSFVTDNRKRFNAAIDEGSRCSLLPAISDKFWDQWNALDSVDPSELSDSDLDSYECAIDYLTCWHGCDSFNEVSCQQFVDFKPLWAEYAASGLIHLASSDGRWGRHFIRFRFSSPSELMKFIYDFADPFQNWIFD